MPAGTDARAVASGAPRKRPVRAADSAGWRRRWAVAGVVTVSVHAGAFMLLSVPGPELADGTEPKSRVAWVGEDPLSGESVLGEQLLLLDNAPLFLPTEWNSSSAENLATVGRPPGEIFSMYEPRLTLAPTRGPASLALLPEGESSPAGALARLNWNYLEAFGRFDRAPVPLESRLARLEVLSAGEGELAAVFILPLSAAQDADAWPDWAPFELLVAVEATGVQAPPLVLAPGSGSERVDDFFRNLARRDLQLDLRLSPGYYTVIVGP